MRRKLATLAALAMGAGLLGTGSAQAQTVPVTVIVTEGIGNVCAAVKGLSALEISKYGNRKTTTSSTKYAWCIYPGAGYDLAVNPGQTTHSQWWVPAKSTEVGKWSAPQGLYAPGIGPGADGPYELTIEAGTPSPPKNVCVDSVEGPGCETRIVGRLRPGPISGHGAHAGSSTGSGDFTFSSANGKYESTGTLGWQQSAATILPLQGQATYKIAGDPTPRSSTLVGFTSSRGAGGDTGNAGATAPTTGFQVEGMIVAY